MNPYDNPPDASTLYQDIQEPVRSAAINAMFVLHRVWTSHVGHIAYVKDNFVALEKAIDDIVVASKSREPEKPKTYKLQIIFDPPAQATLEALKTATGGSAAEVVRDALGLLEWARKQHEAGLTIATLSNGKPVAQVILPFDTSLVLAENGAKAKLE